MKKNLFLLAIVSIAVASCKTTNPKQIDFLEFGWSIDSCRAVLAQHYDVTHLDTAITDPFHISYADVMFNGHQYDTVDFYGDPIQQDYSLQRVHGRYYWDESDTATHQKVEAIYQSIAKDYHLLHKEVSEGFLAYEYVSADELYITLFKETIAPQSDEETKYAFLIMYCYGERAYHRALGFEELAPDTIPLSVGSIPIQGNVAEFVRILKESGEFGELVDFDVYEDIGYVQMQTTTSYFTFFYQPENGKMTTITRVDYWVELPTPHDFYQYANEVSLQYPNYPSYNNAERAFTWHFREGAMTLLYNQDRQGMTYIYNVD